MNYFLFKSHILYFQGSFRDTVNRIEKADNPHSLCEYPTSQWCICYNGVTYFDMSLSPKSHSLHYTFFVYSVSWGKGTMVCIHHYAHTNIHALQSRTQLTHLILQPLASSSTFHVVPRLGLYFCSSCSALSFRFMSPFLALSFSLLAVG